VRVSRLRDIPGIGVDRVGDAADAAADPRFLRLENLDTDIPPPPAARALTKLAVDDDASNSAVAAALAAPDADADVARAVATWQDRCETILAQLRAYPCVRPDGGWSLLIDTAALGIAPAEASARLFERAQVAATPMTGWGLSGERYLRLVFANETAERLLDLRARFTAAFG
jgi:aspartate/methionine/tyrosine aminotransferase